MDSTFFKLANQLGGTGGLAAINFSTNPEGLRLKINPDRAWTWSSLVIGAAEAKLVYARPSLPGYGLLEEFNADKSGSVSTQLRQICGHLHNNGLTYGLLYSDECFWFLRYLNGILYISKGAFVTQERPTVIALLLWAGDRVALIGDYAKENGMPAKFWNGL
ncbi:hypothetical protein WJX75_001216 [Coccomyxa subellipsoidea]|uniref:Profilin n=1 Tax=Coccomyxa subellipsoidea TaxID=248742 RepID=A0ABR2YV79_9CHLO